MNPYDPNAQPSQPGTSWQPTQSSAQPWPPQSPPPPPQQWTTQPGQGQYPYAPPPWYQPGQQWPPSPTAMQPPPQRRRPRLWVWFVGFVIVVSLVSTVLGNAISQNEATQSAINTGATQAASIPAIIHWPPKTIGDLRGLAAKGNASAIHAFSSESVGLTGACPQPKRDATVDTKITGQQFAEDLLAYFFDNQLDSPCGSVVFVEHSQSDAGNGYTAGRIYFSVTDASGNANVDPNASDGLKHTLTLDVGGSLDANAKEYTVMY